MYNATSAGRSTKRRQTCNLQLHAYLLFLKHFLTKQLMSTYSPTDDSYKHEITFKDIVGKLLLFLFISRVLLFPFS